MAISKPISETIDVVTLEVTGNVTVLNQSGSVYWCKKTASGSIVEEGRFDFSGEEYDAWGNDDNYIMQLAEQRLYPQP